MGLTSKQARALLLEKIGPGLANCYKCSKQIFWSNTRGVSGFTITVGYLDGDKENGNPDNIAPLCGTCVRKATAPMAIKDGEVIHIRKNGRRERGVEKVCEECQAKFTISLSHSKIMPNIGRYCSGSCRSVAGNRLRWARWREANDK